MPLKTLFSKAVLKKDITRFAPLWGLYTVFTLLFVLLVRSEDRNAAQFMNVASDIMQAMSIVNLVYGGLCAATLFGDLFVSRMTNMLHAMPIRRETWFFTHLLAGLLFCLVPNALGAAVAAATMGQYAYGAGLWLGVMVLEFLFFFGVAVFSMLCAGNRLGALALYGIINFFAVIVSWLVDVFYMPLLYGVSLPMDQLFFFSPVIQFSQSFFVLTKYDNMKDITTLLQIPAQPWIYAGVTALLGVVALGLALLVYRKRALENAGDFISLKPFSPVFLGIYTLCVGAALFMVFSSIDGIGRYFVLLLGLAMGFFTGKMLLEKKTRVFTRKTIVTFFVCVIAMSLSLVITLLDPAGITRYVPEQEKIAQIEINLPFYVNDENTVTLTDPEDIATIRSLHEKAIWDRQEDSVLYNVSRLNIQYTLKNGSRVERQYYIEDSQQTQETLGAIYSRPSVLLGTNDLDHLLENWDTMEIIGFSETLPYIHLENTAAATKYNLEGYNKETKEYFSVLGRGFPDNETETALLTSLFQDCQTGNMSQWNNPYKSVATVMLTVRSEEGYLEHFNLDIHLNSQTTLGSIKAMAEALLKENPGPFAGLTLESE